MAGQKDNSNDNAQDDFALFRKEMAEVNRNRRKYGGAGEERPLSRDVAPKPTVKIRRMHLTEVAPGAGVMIDQTDGDFFEFCRSGLQKKVLQKLKRGDYGFTATLDLHGHTTAEANRMLPDFVTNALAAGDRTVLIIHGKGLRSGEFGGVLKQFTADWLKQYAEVQAFCSAQPRDGGTGAVYVLLRVGGKSLRAKRLA